MEFEHEAPVGSLDEQLGVPFLTVETLWGKMERAWARVREYEREIAQVKQAIEHCDRALEQASPLERADPTVAKLCDRARASRMAHAAHVELLSSIMEGISVQLEEMEAELLELGPRQGQ